jgi:hypothetical protein
VGLNTLCVAAFRDKKFTAATKAVPKMTVPMAAEG